MAHAGFLDHLLVLFGYPEGSGESLVAGTLRMRYCSLNFSGRKPTWGLPDTCQVSALITAGGPEVVLVDVHSRREQLAQAVFFCGGERRRRGGGP